MWIDTHCHLAGKEFQADLPDVLARAQEAGIEAMIVIGAGDGLEGNQKAIELANQYPHLWATVGIHPHDAKLSGDLRSLVISSKKVVAIGEIGLDYHYDHAPRDVQQERFLEQMALAKELNLPVVIHSREAWDDTIHIVEKMGPLPKGGVFHCFGGNVAEARQALDLGFYISISGIVTFKKAQNLIEVIQQIPLERIVIETDAPFLAPVPYRGKKNEPAFVKLVGEKIAEIKKMPAEKISKATIENTKKLFTLSP